MLKLLVVAAWEPELVRFRERMAGGVPQPLAIAIDTLGVGLVEAAIAMMQCVERHRPSAALLLGTCGAFARSAASASAASASAASASAASGGEDATAALAAPAVVPGAVVTGARVRLVDGSAVAGDAALPAPMPVEVDFDVELRRAISAARAQSVRIANTVGITTDDALASRLARAGDADVEHLEAFAFARACAAAKVRCVTVLGVANMVGARGRAEWLAGHVEASARAADVAFDALPALAAALAVRTSTTAP